MTPSEAAGANRSDADYIVLDPVAYVHALWRQKWSLVVFPTALAAAFLALSYTRPKTYQSVVTFMPPKSIGSPLLLMARGGSGGDEYRAELGSRTVGMDVVKHLNLAERLHLRNDEYALGAARGMSKFGADVNNFVTIAVTSKDPQLSADVANEYYAALGRFSENLSRHEAEHRLNYMSGPMRLEQQRLEAAEDALSQVQQSTGLVVPEAQASLGVQAVASLRTRVSDLQAQLATLMTSSTDANPQVVTLRAQISNLQGQINALEKKNDLANSPANLPKLSLEVARKQREVMLHMQALDSLSKSIGLAQATESYTPSLSLIDPAIPARDKYAPKRKEWAAVGFALGLVFALMRILLMTAFREWRVSPRGDKVRARWRSSWQERTLQTGRHAN